MRTCHGLAIVLQNVADPRGNGRPQPEITSTYDSSYASD